MGGQRKGNMPEWATCIRKYGGIVLKSRVVPISSYEEPKGGIEKTSDEHVVLVHSRRRLGGKTGERAQYVPQTVYSVPLPDRCDPEALEKA